MTPRSTVGASLLAIAIAQTPPISKPNTPPPIPYNRRFFPEGTPLVADKRYSCIGLYNPKSPENVGSVMRAAGCYGVASVFYTGKRYERAADFVTDTKRVHYDIPLIGIDDL